MLVDPSPSRSTAESPASSTSAGRLSRRSFFKLAGAAAAGLLTARCDGVNITHLVNPVIPQFKGDLSMWSSDYLFQWWADGLKAPAKVFNIQTSHYGLSFDFHAFRLRAFGLIANPPTEAEALRQDNRLIESLPEVSIRAALEKGQRYTVIGAGRTELKNTSYEDCQLIESGRYFHRRWLTNLVFEPDAPMLDKNESGLEICAWPDRVAFLLHLSAAEAGGENTPLDGAVLEIAFNLPPEYANFQGATGAGCFANSQGHGYILLGDSTSAALSFDPTGVCTARLQVDNWPAGEARTVGWIVYLMPNASQSLPEILAQENSPLNVQASQTQPEAHDLEVVYQPGAGWHAIVLRNDGDTADYAESSNHRVERIRLRVENPAARPRPLRLNFTKDGKVFGITGLSAVLRDLDGNPIGAPVQLSKNWHRGGALTQSRRFEGPWFHGLALLSIPAGATVELEYVSVNAFWGALPAASHAQLCLVGWGSNQLWEQAAIGSWGESLCFEPDQAQVGGAVLDTRPLMVWGMGKVEQKKWGWTNNVGGADFLVYYNQEVEKQSNSRMKTLHRRLGPNLTEVTYAGTSYDRKIDLEYTVSLYRTDDIVRGIYRLRYDVREKVEFSKLVLFQCGGYDYSYTGERKFAYGNEDGLIKEWDTQWGGFVYRTERLKLSGQAPWVSMHEAVKRGQDFGAWANRGLVVRDWQARLGGQPAAPWIAEIGALVRGDETSLVDFLSPPGVTELLPGDYVEAEIVHIVMPQFAADYYGPNENLRQALLAGENTWKMIHREAFGNHLEVSVARGGEVERLYPIKIRCQAFPLAFQVTGGLGYVPVTFAGLQDYRGFTLEYQVDGHWVALDQSRYGKDFWQADFDPLAQQWELTYSLPLDAAPAVVSTTDERQERQFRLTWTES